MDPTQCYAFRNRTDHSKLRSLHGTQLPILATAPTTCSTDCGCARWGVEWPQEPTYLRPAPYSPLRGKTQSERLSRHSSNVCRMRCMRRSNGTNLVHRSLRLTRLGFCAVSLRLKSEIPLVWSFYFVLGSPPLPVDTSATCWAEYLINSLKFRIVLKYLGIAPEAAMSFYRQASHTPASRIFLRFEDV